MAARGDPHQAQILDRVACGKLMLTVVGNFVGYLLGLWKLGQLATDTGPHPCRCGRALEASKGDHARRECVICHNDRVGLDLRLVASPIKLRPVKNYHDW